VLASCGEADGGGEEEREWGGKGMCPGHFLLTARLANAWGIVDIH
jgi:hypothetical protein